MQDIEPGQPDAEPDTQKDRDARPEIVVLAVVALAIGLFTRFVTRSSLWLDEALSVNIAQLPIGEITEALKHDGHPPLAASRGATELESGTIHPAAAFLNGAKA